MNLTTRFQNPVFNLFAVVTKPISNFISQLENRVYDNYLFSLGAGDQYQQQGLISNRLKHKQFEIDSPEYHKAVDTMIASNSAARDIVMVGIDEKSLTKLNSWPVRRDYYSRFLDKVLVQGKARGVTFDIVFAEQGDKDTLEGLEQLANRLQSPVKEEVITLKDRINYNLQLERSFSQYRSQVVGGFIVLEDDEAALKNFDEVYFPAAAWNYRTTLQMDGRIPKKKGGTYNYEGLRRSLQHNAYFNVAPDRDGIVRHVYLFNTIPVKYLHPDGSVSEDTNSLFASLGMETLNMQYERGLSAPSVTGKGAEIKIIIDSPQINATARKSLIAKARGIIKSLTTESATQTQLLDVIANRYHFEPPAHLIDIESHLTWAVAGDYSDMDQLIMGMQTMRKPLLELLLNEVSELDNQTKQTLLNANDAKPFESLKASLESLRENILTHLLSVYADQMWKPVLHELVLLHSFSTANYKEMEKEFINKIFESTGTFQEVFVEPNLERPDRRIHMEHTSRIGISFKSARQGYVYYSFVDVIENDEIDGMMLNFKTPKRPLEDVFKDRLVILGPTALGISDWRATPIAQITDGMEIHAHVIDNLRKGQQILRLDQAVIVELVILILLIILLPFVLTRLSALPGAFISLLLCASWFGWCYYSIEYHFYYYQVVPTTLYILSIYMYLTTYEYIKEEREKKKTRDAFQHYVNASVVDSVLADPDMLKLGGQKRDMTVLFSDVRGFTTISEKLDATTLVALMNDYLEEMTNLVLDSDGTLDKFIGDAVMAFWGAPLKQEDHAARATHTAIAMLKRMETLTEEIKVKYDVDVAIGIGLNTGPMVVGNMGSKQRFNYTVLGDAVNLGARLEGQTKGYGVYLILSESTYNLVKDWAAGRLLDLIAVKGKTLPVKIFEVVGLKKEMSAEELRGLEEFDAAVHTYYFGRRFKEGIQVFTDLKKYRKGKDKACDLYIERCEDFAENPPPENWDGSYVATSK